MPPPPRQHNIPLSRIYQHLASRDIPRAGGCLHLPDASLPTRRTEPGHHWRCLPMPRLHIMLGGRHQLVYLRQSRVHSVSLRTGDIWFCPPDSHDYEIFTGQCHYIGIIFHRAYTRFIDVHYQPEAGHRSLPPRWYHWHEPRPRAIDSILAALEEIARWTSPPARATASGRQRPAAQRIAHWHSSEHIGHHLALGLLTAVMNWMQREKAPQSPRGKANSSWISIDRYIQENYHRPINRQIAAQELQLHPSRISVLCRQFGGKSFNHILQESRIRHAQRLLQNGTLTIDTVADLSGYSGGAYFIRAFRRATGMTPGAWRLARATGSADESVPSG